MNLRNNNNSLPFCDTDSSHGKALVDKVMTSVKGGTLESAVRMKAKLEKEGVMDIDTYQYWARTIADAPALLHSVVRMTYSQREAEASPL